MRYLAFLVLLFHVNVFAQVKLNTLRINKGMTYSFGETDIIVVDSLIMMDSSRLLLNTLKKENYLHARVLIVGKHCVIEGIGAAGANGRNGKSARAYDGPCRVGDSGTAGTHGLDGVPALHLFLYLHHVSIHGSLRINITGGRGGRGGNGGSGGDGGLGTVHCLGGDGGRGGNGGDGGDGGTGGSLTIVSKEGIVTTEWIGKKIIVWNNGGLGGEGGTRGAGGYGGVSPNRKNGTPGATGQEGDHGQAGRRGVITVAIGK
jgi:hypothetical protein